jgi:hypothetical protein
LVSAMMMPALGGHSAPRAVQGEGQVAGPLGQVRADQVDGSSKLMFSSWSPTSALVDGVNTGSGSGPTPAGPRAARHAVHGAVVRYSFHADR